MDKGNGVLVNVDPFSENDAAAVEIEELEPVDGHRKGVNEATAGLLFETLPAEI